MSKSPPRQPRHLHIFGVSLLLIVMALVFFLFGVKMEATVIETGVVMSPRTITLRATRSGIFETVSSTSAARGKVEPNADAPIDSGTEIARIRPFAGDPSDATGIQLGRESARWLILDVHAADGQRVQEGDPIASVYPLETDDAAPNRSIRLAIEEHQFGSVSRGQDVRIYSNMYHHRTHGIARGVVERLEPQGTEGEHGARKFHVWVQVVDSPFPLQLGSSVRAEILTGKKPTFQIILEH